MLSLGGAMSLKPGAHRPACPLSAEDIISSLQVMCYKHSPEKQPRWREGWTSPSLYIQQERAGGSGPTVDCLSHQLMILMIGYVQLLYYTYFKSNILLSFKHRAIFFFVRSLKSLVFGSGCFFRNPSLGMSEQVVHILLCTRT